MKMQTFTPKHIVIVVSKSLKLGDNFTPFPPTPTPTGSNTLYKIPMKTLPLRFT